jgi:hypothetical protein
MIFISILTLIVAKALPLLNKQISSIHFTRIASIIFIYTGAITLNCLYIQSIGSGIGIYSGLFHITQISQLIEIFLFIIGGLILIGWPQVSPNPINKNSDLISPVLPDFFVSLPQNLKEGAFWPTTFAFDSAKAKVGGGAKKNKQREQNSLESYRLVSSTSALLCQPLPLESLPKGSETRGWGSGARVESYSTDYSIIVLFSILGSSLLISSFDLISLYLSIELQSFGLYVLSTLYRDSESSTSAGLKYFLLGGLSSCLILLGSGLIYSYTGVTNFESLYLLNSISDIDQQYVIQGFSLGLIIIFVGFLFKIAAAPLHNWSPERGLGKPSIVGIKLSNSGNTLELTIPKHNRKVGGG